MELILAICAAFRSNRLSRWLLTTVRVCSKNPDWFGAPLFSGTVDFSPFGSAPRDSTFAPDGDRSGSGHWIPLRANRDRWRNFPHTAAPISPMGAYPPGRGGIGAIYLCEFHCRTGWLLYREAFDSFARHFACSGCDCRRHNWLSSRQSPFLRAHDLAFAGDGSNDRRHEINFHQVNML